MPDDCFQKGFGPFAQVAHPTRWKHPTTEFFRVINARGNSTLSLPGLSLVGTDFWPLLPLPRSLSAPPPRGRVKLHYFIFADVNGWDSKVRVRSCFISISVPGKLGDQEP